ncbi:helix-hairpin-helix domain-containing protein [Metabacillus litoralis]|uniref:helix-hairpin-helix domain-containing protein n=1 Tax=Metabacillus litoralis TaxID=152268 RepID=UPI0020402FDB|nr:helix-hairpin-helix domain-containing protein [Metabacillus litoralis]MCM3650540.1 helix-hairpin-helix domain-containing protein [Metabacillus litoralis]
MSLFQKYKKWIMILSILAALFGLYHYFIKDSPTSELVTTNEEENPFHITETAGVTTNDEIEEERLVVDLKGAIVQPGVYELEGGARVHELLKMAGGLTSEADELAINLAAPLEDGMVIYIPKKGEVTDYSQTSHQEQDDGKVNINVALSEELQTLTGIGPSKAEAIIAYRDENGSFKELEGLLEVSGIGQKSFEKLKDEITIK